MRKLIVKSSLALVLAFFSFSCGNAPKEAAHENHAKVHQKDGGHAHWSHHEGVAGPAHWKDLCDGFSACGGQTQSPINIIADSVVTDSVLPKFEVNYSASKVNIINNGHTVQFNVTGENTLTIGEKAYKLLQFHYHAKSEHELNGEQMPIEVHFVHKYADDDYAVIGVMFHEGDEYELFSKYLAHFPTEKGEYAAEDAIELKPLLPENLSYFHYRGSLTTPPCSEVVSWYLLQNPVEASVEQVQVFSDILHSNYRPVQPLNGRAVYSVK